MEHINKILTLSLTDYFKLLSQEFISKTADSIVKRYTYNKRNSSHKLMRNILIRNDYKGFKDWFDKWKQNSFSFYIEGDSSRRRNGRNQPIIDNKCTISTINHQNISNNNISIVQQDFINRQKTYIERKLRNKEEKINEKENINCLLCPFTPTLYSKQTNKALSKNPFKRLYDDSTRRTKDYSEKQNKTMRDIKEKSKWKSAKKVKGKQQPNQNIGEKLYNDYKLIMKKKIFLQKEIDMERGMFFVPSTNCRPTTSNNCKMKTEGNHCNDMNILYKNDRNELLNDRRVNTVNN